MIAVSSFSRAAEMLFLDGSKHAILEIQIERHGRHRIGRIDKPIVSSMLVRFTPKSTRFGDDFVGTPAHGMLARFSPLHFVCCHEPVYSPSYVGATACPLIPSNERHALNG